MKLHSLQVANFRGIAQLRLDLTDILSRPRPLSLLAGPNGSGKTSFLDAIHTVVRCFEEPPKPMLREGLELSAEQLVRDRRNTASIAFDYSIEATEAEAINEVFAKVGIKGFPRADITSRHPVSAPTRVVWEFPVMSARSQCLYSQRFEPRNSSPLLGARGRVRGAVAAGAYFQRIGGVCYLDQRRSLRISRSELPGGEESLPRDEVLTFLVRYYNRHLTWNTEKFGPSYWTQIKTLFDEICAPARLERVESGPDYVTVIASRDGMEYQLGQMSSGEHQVLRLLVGLVAETAINSIVLIDEIELHLHPTWQRRLVQALRSNETVRALNNQYIVTTHSPYVKELFFADEMTDLGTLD